MQSVASVKATVADKSVTGDKMDISYSNLPKLDYSTSEQDTGTKWIDGKTIYRKVITYIYEEKKSINSGPTIGSLGSIDTLVFISGIVVASDKWKTALSYYENSDVKACLLVSGSGNVSVRFGKIESWPYAPLTLQVIAYYTK